MTGYQIFANSFISSKQNNSNLKTITTHLPYLQKLGINVLYLTPIFKAKTTHKYDTIDYKKIDKNFGNMHDFKLLIQESKKRNIKIILDAVLNHTGNLHPWYEKALNKCEIHSDFYKKNKKGYIKFWNVIS